jgi:hypothetical protein
MARKPRNAATTPAPVATTPAPVATTPAPVAAVDASPDAKAPAGGYVLRQEGNPSKKEGSMRHKRWALLVQHAGQPGGWAAYCAAAKAAGVTYSPAGQKRTLAKAGLAIFG